jgi:hypothetical protein
LSLDLPPVRKGDVIRADDYNALRREVERLRNIRGSEGVDVRGSGPGGPTIAVNPGGPQLIRARVTGGDIAAFEDTGADEASVGECTLYEWNRTTLKRELGTETVEVFNDYPAIIPDDTDVWLAEWEDYYWIAIINCPVPP